MNKKGVITFIFLILIILIIGIFWVLNHFDIIEFDKIKTGLGKCKEDCVDLGFEYIKYNPSLFSHSECWCRNKNETKRIY